MIAVWACAGLLVVSVACLLSTWKMWLDVRAVFRITINAHVGSATAASEARASAEAAYVYAQNASSYEKSSRAFMSASMNAAQDNLAEVQKLIDEFDDDMGMSDDEE